MEVALAGVDPLLLKIAQRRNQLVFGARFIMGEIGVAKGVKQPLVEAGDQTALAAFKQNAVINLIEINKLGRRVRHGAALVPGTTDFAAPRVGGQVEVHGQFDGRHLGIEGVARGLGAEGQIGVERVPGQVHGVVSHVANLPGTEIPIHVPGKTIHARPALEVTGVVGMK